MYIKKGSQQYFLVAFAPMSLRLLQLRLLSFLPYRLALFISYLRAAMNLLIKNAVIINGNNSDAAAATDILIQDEKIAAIGTNLETDSAQVYDAGGAYISLGWVDVFSQFGEPGFEYRETLSTGAAAAAAGGFTHVFLLPHSLPPIQSRSAAEYISKSNTAVYLHPVGAITQDCKGKELTEMYDIAAGGAVAFSDGWQPVQSAGLAIKALEYVKAIGKTIIQFPQDDSISPNGLINEGTTSVLMGLSGRPAIAEELAVTRDLALLQYTGGSLHLTGISTAGSVALIKKAKEAGHNITCSVSPQHLYFVDEDVEGYNSSLKLDPPLRGRQDVTALRAAVAEGVIDTIASHHQPQHTDAKKVEFAFASPGAVSLQTAFAATVSAVPSLTPQAVVHLFSTKARKQFGLPSSPITVGVEADLTIFSMSKNWTFEASSNRSLSANSPYLGKSFGAAPLGVFCKGQLILNSF